MAKLCINRVALCHWLYILLCVAGLGWQFIQVSLNYFSFSTSTRVTISYPHKFDFPALSLCIRYTDILNYSMANSHGQNWTRSKVGEDIRRVQEEITIKQIFDWTPDGYDLVATFYRRNPGSYTISSYVNESIKSHLDIRKYIFVEFICYRMSPKEPTEIKKNVVESQPVRSGTVGKFSMSKLFNKVSFYKLSLHKSDAFPYESLRVQPNLERDVTNLAVLNAVSLFHTHFTVNYLQSPYSTDCFEYKKVNLRERADCVMSCITRATVHQLSKYPYSSFIFDSSDRNIISPADTQDPSIASKIDQIATRCENEPFCKRLSCQTRIAITHLQFFNGIQDQMDIYITSPQHPWIRIVHEPSIRFVTYLTLVFGAFGIWTGISIISISPFKLFMTKRPNHNSPILFQRSHTAISAVNQVDSPHLKKTKPSKSLTL